LNHRYPLTWPVADVCAGVLSTAALGQASARPATRQKRSRTADGPRHAVAASRIWPWACIALLSARASFASVGFQQLAVPDGERSPLSVAVWYPSADASSAQPLGMFTQTVALNGVVSGRRWPLVVISHGNGGSSSSHYDTALTLAAAGFIVAALTHTGDNSADQRYAGNRTDLIDRPRQVTRLVDYMVAEWAGRDHVDGSRIGIFGFSLGGFTAIVAIGGTPDLRRMALLCSAKPDAPECVFIRQRHGDQLDPISVDPVWIHDPRIKAAVIAAPAVGFLFGPGSLRDVGVPIQLWRAENDRMAPDAWNASIVRQELSQPVENRVVKGADHFVFLAPCSETLARLAPQVCRDAPGIDRVAFHTEFNRAVAEFFRRCLRTR